MNTVAPSLPPAQLQRTGRSDQACRRPVSKSLYWLKVDRAEWRLGLRLGLPIMMTVWVTMGMSLTDTWMVSRLGPEAMAAVAVSSDAYSIVFYFFSGLIAGLMPTLAAAVANGERMRVQQLWAASWAVSGLCLLGALPAVWSRRRY